MTPTALAVAKLLGLNPDDKGKDLDLPECDGTDWCGVENCQLCCCHDELDHGICIDCGADRHDALVDAAEAARDYALDMAIDERKGS